MSSLERGNAPLGGGMSANDGFSEDELARLQVLRDRNNLLANFDELGLSLGRLENYRAAVRVGFYNEGYPGEGYKRSEG